MNVLSIGYGRQMFDEDNAERARLAACALTVAALHMIVFSRKVHHRKPVCDGNLFLYPTDSRSRVAMLFDAYRIGSSILREHRKNIRDWVISSQDPFEAGLVGYLLHLRYGAPLQVQEHGDFFGTAWWRKESMRNQVRYVFGKWLLKRADCVRAVSARVARHLEAIGVAPSRITTLAVASDISSFADARPIPVEHDLRAKYSDAEAIVLAVGRLVKEKNVALLIRAFKKVVGQHPSEKLSARLVIIGSGPEETALARLVKNLDLSATVSFISWTDDVASYMRSADIFALSSYREGWGRVIVEAMAAGLPCVVTDVGCVGEVFVDGHHGVVVPVADEEAFAQGLRQMIADPQKRHEYGANAARDIAAFTAAQPPYPEAWRRTVEACGIGKNQAEDD